MQKVYLFILMCWVWISFSQAMNNPKVPQADKRIQEHLAQELIDAAGSGTQATIVRLLNEKADPNVCVDGRNALHEAARFGRAQIVGLLINSGAQVDAGAPGYLNASALSLAVYHGYSDVVEELIRANADVNHPLDKLKATPLHIAAMKGRLRIAQLLVDADANLNARNKDNCTPLHSVAECGRWEIIQFMNVAAKQSEGASSKKILEDTSKNVYVAIADLFLSKGAHLEHNPIKGTPLHLAARHCQPELVRLLIQRGANLFAQRPISATPLHEAIVGFATEHSKQGHQSPSTHRLMEAFLTTPSKPVEREAKKAAFPVLCCFARMRKGEGVGTEIAPEKRGDVFSRDLRHVLWSYCLVPFLVEEQLKELKKLFEVRMKFGPMDWTPSELATAQAGNSKNPALLALAELLNPAKVEQHRKSIYDYLYKLLRR